MGYEMLWPGMLMTAFRRDLLPRSARMVSLIVQFIHSIPFFLRKVQIFYLVFQSRTSPIQLTFC